VFKIHDPLLALFDLAFKVRDLLLVSFDGGRVPLFRQCNPAFRNLKSVLEGRLESEPSRPPIANLEASPSRDLLCPPRAKLMSKRATFGNPRMEIPVRAATRVRDPERKHAKKTADQTDRRPRGLTSPNCLGKRT
jgi:hypothetical protein